MRPEMEAQLLDLANLQLQRNVLFGSNIYRCVSKKEADPNKRQKKKFCINHPDPGWITSASRRGGGTSHQKLVVGHQS